MELSRRLQAVAAMVTAGYTLADIGTDHAYIPIYLVEHQIVPRAVAMDINEGPLDRARAHVEKHGLTGQIALRLSDGMKELRPGEAQSAVIAGMGGALMIRILQDSKETVESLRECILQPQSEIAKVRAFLLQEGFLFIQEDMVEEDGKFYPMMKVVPRTAARQMEDGFLPEETVRLAEDGFLSEGTARQMEDGSLPMEAAREQTREQKVDFWDEIELQYGKLLLKRRHPVLRAFLEKEIAVKKEILRNLGEPMSERAQKRKAELLSELARSEKGMEYYAVQRDYESH